VTRFGLTLPNRAVVTGRVHLEDVLETARLADSDEHWDSVWVGDSILAKPRLDALVLMGLLAGLTKRVRLGPACFASTPLRHPLLLAYQWATLDFVSNGRTVFVACQGAAVGGGRFDSEFAAFQIDPATRMRRLEEAIEILRLTLSEAPASYDGTYTSFSDVSILPRPRRPIPIWVVANPDPRRPELVERALRRVAKYGDGWMTDAWMPTVDPPGTFAGHLQLVRRFAAEAGRDLPSDFEACLYFNINVNEDRDQAYLESKQFLDEYYMIDADRELVERWVALGSPQECIQKLASFIAAGATTITLRFTGPDQRRQFERVSQEILPALTPL
jgi:alkanesulfonate monooxygenase SsuD/methylene tetrahydromethanopterin reductase-like flavin-dependent oxidoreductase (luciferase family)